MPALDQRVHGNLLCHGTTILAWYSTLHLMVVRLPADAIQTGVATSMQPNAHAPMLIWRLPLRHLQADGGSNAENLALQNIQARLRMVLAFFLAQVLLSCFQQCMPITTLSLGLQSAF